MNTKKLSANQKAKWYVVWFLANVIGPIITTSVVWYCYFKDKTRYYESLRSWFDGEEDQFDSFEDKMLCEYITSLDKEAFMSNKRLMRLSRTRVIKQIINEVTKDVYAEFEAEELSGK